VPQQQSNLEAVYAAYTNLNPDDRASFKLMLIHSLAQDIIGEMKSEGKAMELTEEEERMLWSFRRFRLRTRKNGEVFGWQKEARSLEAVFAAYTNLNPDDRASFKLMLS
jgi:hypothetical protein